MADEFFGERTAAPPEMVQLSEPASDRLVLTGDLTVRSIRRIHEDITELLRANAVARIDCTAASDIDLSFIQLLLAARRTAAAEGKAVALVQPAGGVLLERLLQAGLIARDGDEAVADEAFWRNKEGRDGKDHTHGG